MSRLQETGTALPIAAVLAACAASGAGGSSLTKEKNRVGRMAKRPRHELNLATAARADDCRNKETLFAHVDDDELRDRVYHDWIRGVRYWETAPAMGAPIRDPARGCPGYFELSMCKGTVAMRSCMGEPRFLQSISSQLSFKGESFVRSCDPREDHCCLSGEPTP